MNTISLEFFLWSNFSWPKIFHNPKFFYDLKFSMTQNFSGSKIFSGLKFLWPNIFWNPYFLSFKNLGPIIFHVPKFSGTWIFWNTYFWKSEYFWQPHLLVTKIFQDLKLELVRLWITLFSNVTARTQPNFTLKKGSKGLYIEKGASVCVWKVSRRCLIGVWKVF